MDEPALKELLPKQHVVEVGAVRIGMVHDAGSRARREARLAARFPECEAVVYGHSHVPQVDRFQHLWVLNPGSPYGQATAAAADDARAPGSGVAGHAGASESLT
jgi:predicted phosphodiesterase